MNYSNQINRKLDIFFDKKDDRYADIEMFDEIFNFLENSDFEEKNRNI